MSKFLGLAVLSLSIALCYRFLIADNADVASLSSTSDGWNDLWAEAKNQSKYSKSVEKVTDGIYVAMNYAFSNVIMIEGEDGIIVVDTTENIEIIEDVMGEFRKITRKPLKAIILTHFHLDHIRGVEWLLDNAEGPVEVYAHRLITQEVSRNLIALQSGNRRGIKVYGAGLNERAKRTVPGPKLRLKNAETFVALKPTHEVDEVLETTVAGMRLKLLHIPGETPDQIAVWIPEKRALLPADTVYEAFPDIGAVKSDFPRSAVDWIRSIDKLRYLRPQFLVPAHMRPMNNEAKIFELLTTYRDGIQFVHDQTVRLTNLGLHVSDIVRQVKLPPSLVDLPHLSDFYSKLAWAVRAINANYTGWFSGEAHELNPLTMSERADKTREMLEECTGDTSGVDAMIRSSEENAQKSMDHFQKTGHVLFIESQWALEVANAALTVTRGGSTEYERAKKAKIHALLLMARYSKSINAKNYYLSCAAELDGGLIPLDLGNAKKIIIDKMEIEDLLYLFAMKINPEKCDSFMKITAILHFTDLKKSYGFILRNCIIEYVNDKTRLPEAYDVKLTMASQVWRDLVSKERGGMGAYMSGDMVVDGSLMSFKAITDTIN